MVWLLFLVVSIILADQVIKYIVATHMYVGQSIPIISDYLHLTYILNPGAAFGIFAHHPYWFLGVGVLLIILVVILLPKILKLPPLMRLAVGLLVAGAIGNMIDRIRIHRVIDYIDFRVWPIFNLADIAIVLAALILIYTVLMGEETDN